MNPENLSPELEETIKLLLKNPRTARKFLQSAGIPSVSLPYYNERLAKELVPYIDKMLETKEDFAFPIDVFGGQMSVNTLKKRMLNTIKYIVDHLDNEDKRYLNWRLSVEVCIEDTAIVLRWRDRPKFEPNSTWYGYPVTKRPESHLWRSELADWIESDKPLFHKTGLTLKSEDIIYIKELFSTSPAFTARVSESEIKVIRERIEDEETNDQVCESGITEQTDSSSDEGGEEPTGIQGAEGSD